MPLAGLLCGLISVGGRLFYLLREVLKIGRGAMMTKKRVFIKAKLFDTACDGQLRRMIEQIKGKIEKRRDLISLRNEGYGQRCDNSFELLQSYQDLIDKCDTFFESSGEPVDVVSNDIGGEYRDLVIGERALLALYMESFPNWFRRTQVEEKIDELIEREND
jgi:hypothetical protein